MEKEKGKKEERSSYQQVREGSKGFTDSEPEDAVAYEGGERTDEEDNPRWELVAGEARHQTDILADIVGDTEKGELALVEAQHGFQRVRV